MAAPTDLPRVWIRGCLAACVLILTGCQTMHDVKIDAINNPSKPSGYSYVLAVHDPAGGVDQELGVQAVTRVKSALASRGMFEAPANTKPDMVVNLEYGVGPGEIKILYRSGTDTGSGMDPMQGPSAKPILVYEKYLSLSAREIIAPEKNASARGGGRKGEDRGEELWGVRVSVEDPKKDLGPYLPVLANASIDYIDRNTGSEVHLELDANGYPRGR